MFKFKGWSFCSILIATGLFINIGYSYTVLNKIPVPSGNEPISSFYSKKSQKIYTANLWNINMSVINMATRELEATIPMPGGYMACLFVGVDDNNEKIYLGDITNIRILSQSDYSLITTLAGIKGTGFSSDSSEDRVYIAGAPNLVYIIQGVTSTIINTINVGEFDASTVNPNNLLLDDSLNFLYIACNREKKIDVIDCNSDTILTSIEVDTLPIAIDINPETRKIYVACDSSVIVVNSENQGVLDTINIGGHPTDITINNNKIYVAMGDSNIVIINGDTDAIEGSVPFSTTFIHCDNNEIYLTVENENTIKILSTPDYLLIETITLAYFLHDLVMDETRNILFVAATTRTNENFVFKIDCNIDSIVDTLFVNDESPYALYIAYDENLQKLYLAERILSRLYCIDGTDMSILSSHNLPGNPMYFNANPNTGKVYIPMLNSAQLLVFDGISDSIEALIDIHIAPIDAEVNQTTNKIFVSTEDWYLDIIDGATNTVDTSIYLTSGPYLECNCINEVTNEIYVCSYDGRNVTIIDGNQDYKIVKTIPLGHVVRDGDVNESTNHAFIYTANDKIFVIDGESHNIIDSIIVSGGKLEIDNNRGILYVLEDDGILIIKDDSLGVEETKFTNKPMPINLTLLSNPSSNGIRIQYNIKLDAVINLSIYDMSGRCVKKLANGKQTKGIYNEKWDAKGMASGTYFVRLTVGNMTEVRKLILIK